MPQVPSQASIEQLTQQIGLDIFSRLDRRKPHPLQFLWWEERMMRLMMGNERLKLKAFRFIDVLPTLSSSREIARHLKEYFVEPEWRVAKPKSHAHGEPDETPAERRARQQAEIAELGGGQLDLEHWLSRQLDFDDLTSLKARFFSFAARTAAVQMARRFIAGTNIMEAERTLRQLRGQNLAFSIDVLGEAACSTSESDYYTQVYMGLITELPRKAQRWQWTPLADQADDVPIPPVNVSVKLTSLFSQFDPIDPDGTKLAVKDRLRPLLRRGMEGGCHVHIDMEHYAIKNLTLEIFKEVLMEAEFRDYPHFGIVLQAYLKDGPADAADMIDFARKRGVPLWIRLVKGAYWDSETIWSAQNHWPCPVWRQKWQSDACYERMTRMLLENHQYIYTAFGSHNIRSVAHALAMKQALHIPPSRFEIQMLYGMGDPIKQVLVDLRERCRVYTPYGQLLPGMAYFIRRLLENTANESFLRHTFDSETPKSVLLRDPNEHGDSNARGASASGRCAGAAPAISARVAPAISGCVSNSTPAFDLEGMRGIAQPLIAGATHLHPLLAGATRLHPLIAGATHSHRPDADAPQLDYPTKFEFGETIMDPFENVPNADFSLEANRQKMIRAIADVRGSIGKRYPLIVGGRQITTDSWKESVNPGKPSEVIGQIAQADAAIADRAVEVAHEAYKSWRLVEPHDRAEVLFRAAEIMEQRRFELSALMSLECGKPWREADADTSEAIDFCNYYGKEMIRMAENARRRDIPGETNEYFYAPRGVVAVISPWNFPLAILTGMATAAIVTGNAVIMKPAAPAAVIAAKLMEILEIAGLPAGVANYLPGPGALAGEVLVKHPKVAMIAFTGSREVGCRINRIAAETTTSQPALKKVIAEMGGKNATIVDSDADLDEAVRGLAFSAFGYAGQKCSASSRCIVVADVYERFVERLVEASRSAQVGPADDCGTFVPPVIDKGAYDNIRKYIEIGKSEARCVLDGDTDARVLRLRADSRVVEQPPSAASSNASLTGYFIGPTIFADVPRTARIAREEIFGPVLAVIRAADIDEAIEIFNDTDFALTGGIFSRSPANIAKARAECDCGNFYINRKITGALVDIQPFGGFKMSGIGSKAGGPDYLIQFCEPRTVTENTLRRGFAPSEELVATA
ncbi:MAG: L-glutamate gamma-semialdehyde dehydrogenase [Phycisphaerae bacterium]